MKFRTSIVAVALVLAATAGFLMKCRGGKTAAPTSGPPAVSLEVRIKNVAVRPTGDHAQLILTAVFKQSGQAPIRLEPPLVSLMTAQQIPAARYLGPVLPDPVLPGPDPAEVTLYYWLPMADLKAPLTLEASGRRYPVELPSP